MTSTEKFAQIVEDLSSDDFHDVDRGHDNLRQLSVDVLREQAEPPDWPRGRMSTEFLHYIADALHTAYEYEMRELD